MSCATAPAQSLRERPRTPARGELTAASPTRLRRQRWRCTADWTRSPPPPSWNASAQHHPARATATTARPTLRTRTRSGSTPPTPTVVRSTRGRRQAENLVAACRHRCTNTDDGGQGDDAKDADGDQPPAGGPGGSGGSGGRRTRGPGRGGAPLHARAHPPRIPRGSAIDAAMNDDPSAGLLLWRSHKGPAHLSTHAVQRLACDARIRHVFTDDTRILGVGRGARRDPRFGPRRRDRPGYRLSGFRGAPPRRQHCDCHHVIPRSRGGPATLENLVLCCRRHHRAVHEHGWTAVPRPGLGGGDRDPPRRHLHQRHPRRHSAQSSTAAEEEATTTPLARPGEPASRRNRARPRPPF